MHIIWSERAFIRRQVIEDYILCQFGYATHAKFLSQIEECKSALLQNPRIGKIEPILEGMKKEYRSIVIGHLSKCIYYIEDDTIVFVDWWDTRRELKMLVSGL